MTVEQWCKENLDGGFVVLGPNLRLCELFAPPARHQGRMVFFDVRNWRGLRETAIATRMGDRRSHEVGARWRVDWKRPPA